MGYCITYGSDAKYLAASDILISDMSDIIYEYLVFDRPIILLSSNWVKKEIPDLGIKCSIDLLGDAIDQSLNNPKEYSAQRQVWLNKTHHKPDRNSSRRVLEAIIQKSRMANPTLFFIHGNNQVVRDTIRPIYNEALNMSYPAKEISRYKKKYRLNNGIYVSAHNEYLKTPVGYKVHVDHGNKGPGVSPIDYKKEQWKQNNYWCDTDLFITEGEVSQEKTRIVLGPYSNKALMVGFPRSDDYLRLEIPENKKTVCEELGIDYKIPLITYAPAGEYSYPTKQGGSLSKEVLSTMKKIGRNTTKYNILVKHKYPKSWIIHRIKNKLYSTVH